MARVVIVALLLCVGGFVYLQSRDPESAELDAAARAVGGGSFVQLPDGMTHYDVSGPEAGPRVLLVHGFSVPAYIWDSTVVALTAAGYRVARYDTYGRGFSDRPDVAYDLDLFARQLGGVLDSLGWREPVHLVGLSFGGPITATFTRRSPERVRTLTLVDPAAGPTGLMPWYLRLPWLGERLWQAMVVPTLADGQLSDFVEPAKWPDWPDRYRVQMQYRGFGRSLLRTRLALGGSNTDTLYAAVGATQRPVHLIWGTLDQTVAVTWADSIRRVIPQAQYLPVEGAGHLPHMERSVLVHGAMQTFFRAHTPADTLRAAPLAVVR
ncbi:MAG: alpha/beta fold hydrolase [Gemmatimonadetes bacterium]|nr:alpha/beta fold hydrolase [Gemmatimonadota bacterium]